MLRNINDIADHYSAVFIGCGISSLYSAYRWCRRYPDKTNILLVERTGRIGGRVQTTRHGRYTTEAGAGRFSSSHTYLMELIRELGLDDRIVRLPEETHYFIDGVLLKTDADIDRHFNLRGRTISDLWHHICASVALDNGNRERAYTMTLLDYIQTIGLRENEIRAIRCTFGYSAEMTLMNAGHAIELAGADYNIIYDRTSKKSTYYVLRGGLEQVVHELVKRLTANGATFLLNTECYQVYSNKNTCRVHLEQYPNGKVHCNTEQCVVGCPSSAFRAIRFITRETSTASYKRVTIPEKYMPSLKIDYMDYTQIST
jgi:protoporphyrinogen oxidase